MTAIQKVTVIDAPCGAGKTSFSFQEINAHPERRTIFISPLLDELARVKEKTNYADGRRRFFEPTYRRGRKLDDFNALLCEGRDIASTHSTFSNVNQETEEYLRAGKYHLILDEVLDILSDFNKVCADDQRVKEKDIQLLLEGEYIEIDEFGRVNWIGQSYIGSGFTDVERLAKRGNLLYLDGKLFMWEFPAEIFRLFESVTVLTYM